MEEAAQPESVDDISSGAVDDPSSETAIGNVAATKPDLHEVVADDTEPTPTKRRWRRHWVPREVKITITLLALYFVVIYILLPEFASARRDFNRIGQLNVFWLILGVILEGGALAAYAELSHTVLSPGAPHRFRLLRINMWSLCVSHVLPGGTAPGAVVCYRQLLDSEVPGSTAAFGMATQGLGSAVVLNVIFWLALLISIPLNGYNPYYGFAALLGVLLLAAFSASVYLLTKGQRHAADWLTRVATHVPLVNPDKVAAQVQRVASRLQILLKDRSLLYHALLWAALNWLADAASLWVFLFAFGAHVSPIDLLVAYGLANILAVIPITPGGLGVVEFFLITVLTGFGTPTAAATAGVLSWRLVNFWLPIPLGGVSYLTLRFGPAGRAMRGRREARLAALRPANPT